MQKNWADKQQSCQPLCQRNKIKIVGVIAYEDKGIDGSTWGIMGITYLKENEDQEPIMIAKENLSIV